MAIILVDARHGVIEQTKRHAYIASLLQIPHVVVCVNKMDLEDFSEEAFQKVHKDFEDFSAKLDIKDVRFVPISALLGDNVVDRSEKMEWYQGPTLMHILENVHIGSDQNHIDSRFPVQYVVRPMSMEYHDYRGYAGRVGGGILRAGDEVSVLPSGFTSKIKSIDSMNGPVQEAFPPMSVTITLEDDIDISRGDMIVKVGNQPRQEQEFDVMVCWMNEKPMQLGGKYALKHTSRDARCIIKDVKYKMNINTMQKIEDDNNVGLNDIARVTVRTTVPMFIDGYRKNRNTGSLILVDEATNNTVGAGMIV
jgi:sulfate adenylyltransferase subunit 1